jgi:hypothetical protein
MAGVVSKTRLEHFLEAYQPLGLELQQRIWDRVHRAGWSADDPMSLQIAHETIMEDQLASFVGKLATLPLQLDKAVQQALDKVAAVRARETTADRQAIAIQVAQEATAALQAALPRFEKSVFWRAAQRLFLTLAIIGLLCGAGGYIWGRHDTSQLESAFAGIAERADAKTWIRLLELNANLDWTLAKACAVGGSGEFVTAEGRRACAVPLWLETPIAAPPGPLTVLDLAADHFASLSARLPFLVTLAIGALFGTALVPLLHRLRRWVIGE